MHAQDDVKQKLLTKTLISRKLFCHIYSAEKNFLNPKKIRPQRIEVKIKPGGVMRRVREAVRELDATTLTKLVHEMPAKMQEIYRLKGQKISPGWKAKNSKYACRCSVCSS